MRILRNQTIITFLILLSLSNCVKQPRVYVESGKINEFEFYSNGAFKADDPAIGKIDSTLCLGYPKRIFNGYKLIDGKVYVFEKQKIPKKLNRMNSTKLNQTLSLANWGLDAKSYELKNDALVCEDTLNAIFYSRSAGITKRDTATIFGGKVYRFIDSVYKEDYHKLVNYHLNFEPDVNFFEILGIDSTTHSMTTNRIKIFPNIGKIDFTSDSTKFEYDKIYFKPKKNIEKNIKKIENLETKNKSFLIRIVLIKHKDAIRNIYFNNANVVIDSTTLTNYLYKNLLPKYRPEFIRNYDCNGCTKYSINIPKLDLNGFPSNMMPAGPDKPLPPPLPLVANY